MKRFAPLMVLLIAGSAAADIAGWRTDATGRYPKAQGPLAWSASKNVVWKTPMPAESNATPVIAGDNIYVCAEPTTLICVNALNGRIKWQKTNSYEDLSPPKQQKMPRRHNTNGYSSPTPVTDGWRVYALFGNGVAACYNRDGERQWINHVDTPTHGWGHSASPVLVGDTLLVIIKDLRALDAKTGRQLWRIDMNPHWGTPVAARIGETDVVITPAGKIVRVSDGHVLADDLGKLNYNAPIVDGDMLYFIDGEQKTRAYRLPKRAGNSVNLAKLWDVRIQGNRYYASPLLHNGLIHAINQSGIYSVIDTANGDVVLKRKLQLGGTAYPSIALAGDRLYVSSDTGKTLVLQPGRAYKELASNQLDVFRASPVFDGGRMYIRTYSHLYCISDSCCTPD